MSFQAYLDTVLAKTGKTPDDFAVLAREKGLSKHGPIVAWLKTDFGLGHGHANAIAGVLLKSAIWSAPVEDRYAALFGGARAALKPLADDIVAKVRAFGPDVEVAANETYVNLQRGKKKLGILQPAADRLDVGIKRKGAAADGRYEAAGAWNTMVTHRVRVTSAAEVDADLIGWLRAAYEGA
jgi:hypothetical protein